MGLTYGFYNSIDGDRRVYDATDIASIFDGIITDGVFGAFGDHLQVVPNGGMNIKVRSGRAWFNHTWTYNSADYITGMTIETAHVSLNRKDAVVLEVNASSEVRANSIFIKKGTDLTSGNPNPPTMVHTATINQYPLAYISVPAGTTEITEGLIISTLGTAELPIVEGPLNTVDITELVAHWQGQFETWFRNLQIELDENVAATLLEKTRLLKEVRHVNLVYGSWVKDGSFWKQTVERDENNILLGYTSADNPVIVDGIPENSSMTTSQLETYFKNFSAIISGKNVMTATGGFIFYVSSRPTSDIRIGLKGV